MGIASSAGRGVGLQPTRVVAFCHDASTERAVASALGWNRLEFCQHVRRVIPQLRATGASLLIVEPSGADLAESTDLVHAIRGEAPAFTVAVLKRLSDKVSGDRVAMTAFGMGDILVVDAPHFADRLSALVNRQRILDRVAECGAHLTAGLPPDLAKIVGYAFTREGVTCQSVDAFRARLGFRERELQRFVRRVGLSPKKIIAWRRLFVAIVLDEHTLMTLDQIALEAGYSSAAALQRAIYDFGGVRHRALMAAGGSLYLLRVFRGAMGLM